jgi:hypothetical protein
MLENSVQKNETISVTGSVMTKKKIRIRYVICRELDDVRTRMETVRRKCLSWLGFQSGTPSADGTTKLKTMPA